MAKLNPIYNSSLTCPVCDRKIEVTKVRSRFVKLSGQDEDFCPYYETYNPILYEAWVCKYCGYAAHSTVFTEVSFNERKQVLENIKPKWTSRDFTGERDIDKALETFKIVLYNLQVRGAPLSEFGKICLRIAWMYRYKGEWVDEYKYLKYSYEYYKNSYSQEYLSNKNLMNIRLCTYWENWQEGSNYLTKRCSGSESLFPLPQTQRKNRRYSRVLLK